MLTIVKKNDSYDAITYQLENEDNSTVDLTGASVNFVMGKKNKLITNAKATVTSATSGIVSYQLTPLDTLVSGTFLAEFVVTFANGTIKTYPSNGYITVDVEQNLDTNQNNVVLDMIAEKQGDFTAKLSSILLQAGNINMSAMNDYTWTATDGQLVFIFPSSVNYNPSTKWFQVYVGGIPIDNSFINRSYTNQFALNVDSSNIKAGMTVRAMWVEPITPLTENVVRTINGIIPDDTGNVTITTSSGSGVLVYQTLSDLQTAYPNGVNQPAWIVADNAWYYWDGVINPTVAPSDVTSLTSSSISTTTLTLSWTASSLASSYDVYNGATLLGNTASTTFNVSGLTASTTYTFKVVAKNSVGSSTGVTTTATTITVDTTAPNEVTNLTATNITKTGTTLNWTVSTSSDTASYDIYNGATLLGTVAHPNGVYAITGLTLGTSYTFTVKAKDATGNVSTGVSVPVTTLAASGYYIGLDGVAGKVVIPNPAGTRIMTMKLARRNNDTGVLFDFRSSNTIYAGNSSTGYNTFEINGVSHPVNYDNVVSLPNDTVVDLKVTLTADAVAGNISIGKHYSAVDYLNMDLYDVKLYDVNMTLLSSFTFSGTGTTLAGTNGNGTITSGTWVAY